MTTPPRDIGLPAPSERSQWVPLRTLTWLRWVAIAGQLIALEVAHYVFGLQIDTGPCYLVVGAAVIANLLAIAIYPKNKRLSEREAMLMLLFDVTQLALLLGLTGGLNNPFALLMLTPVTISATALGLGSTLLLGGVAVGLVTLLAYVHRPLRDAFGDMMYMPDIFLFGFWVAIVIGVAFLAGYARRVSSEINAMSDALLATQMALAREQKLTDLGGVIAAAAHELGTPLATIKLVSSELSDELADNPVLREDAALIAEQADRCRDILHSMGRAGKDDLHLHTAPLQRVLEEAAEPHQDRGKALHYEIGPLPGGEDRQPTIRRRPEIIHGLRNLVQNAVDFADGNVWLEGFWNDEQIGVRISDDGAGYTQQVLDRIGDPFMRHRRTESEIRARPGYAGMGLGLFIAKTLLERTGAQLSFANGSDPYLAPENRPERCGAVVEVIWPRGTLAAETSPGPLGENQPILG